MREHFSRQQQARPAQDSKLGPPSTTVHLLLLSCTKLNTKLNIRKDCEHRGGQGRRRAPVMGGAPNFATAFAVRASAALESSSRPRSSRLIRLMKKTVAPVRPPATSLASCHSDYITSTKAPRKRINLLARLMLVLVRANRASHAPDKRAAPSLCLAVARPRAQIAMQIGTRPQALRLPWLATYFIPPDRASATFSRALPATNSLASRQPPFRRRLGPEIGNISHKLEIGQPLGSAKHSNLRITKTAPTIGSANIVVRITS